MRFIETAGSKEKADAVAKAAKLLTELDIPGVDWGKIASVAAKP